MDDRDTQKTPYRENAVEGDKPVFVPPKRSHWLRQMYWWDRVVAVVSVSGICALSVNFVLTASPENWAVFREIVGHLGPMAFAIAAFFTMMRFFIRDDGFDGLKKKADDAHNVAVVSARRDFCQKNHPHHRGDADCNGRQS